MKKYFRALDHAIAAVEFASKGDGVSAAKSLARAAKSPDMKEAVAALNAEQAKLHKTVTASTKPKTVEITMSQALARLLKTAKSQVTAGENPFGDDQDDQDDEQQETAADEDQDDQDDEDDDQEEEDAATKQVTAADDDQDIDIDLDDEDREGEDEQEQEVSRSVPKQVSARLARAERNKAKRG